MKSLKIFTAGIVGVAALACSLLSCSREYPLVAGTTNVTNGATLQVFSATIKATRNYVYVDGVPVSGAALAYQGIFPATAYGFQVSAGQHTFLIKDTLASSTQAPITFTQSVEPGKNYTIFTYDTITSAKQSTVLNNITIPKDTTCMLRFANFIYSTTALPNVDVYSFRRGNATPIFTNVATAQVTNFIPYASGLTDTLYVYATGTTTPLLAKSFVTSLVPTRSYTAAYNGSNKGTKVVTTFATY